MKIHCIKNHLAPGVRTTPHGSIIDHNAPPHAVVRVLVGGFVFDFDHEATLRGQLTLGEVRLVADEVGVPPKEMRRMLQAVAMQGPLNPQAHPAG